MKILNYREGVTLTTRSSPYSLHRFSFPQSFPSGRRFFRLSFFFASSNHHRPPLGVNRQVLTRNYPPASGLPKCLRVNFIKHTLLLVVLQNHNPPGIGTSDNLILLRSSKSELSQRANSTEYFDEKNDLEPTDVVGTEEIEKLSPRNDDLLELPAREAFVNGGHHTDGSLRC
ncbi:unnamed protein product [Linum trigynum]|uniref:Uncharacterized protein n=1 Tax=Linum trigynum TaxID=586398 RepID=A0AAV2CS17_9ROSI